MKRHTSRIVIAIVFVVALHAVLLAFMFTRHDAAPATSHASQTITIQLLHAAGNPRAEQAPQMAPAIQTKRTIQAAQPHTPVRAAVPPQAPATPARPAAVPPSHAVSTMPAHTIQNNAAGTAPASPSESGQKQGETAGKSPGMSGSGGAGDAVSSAPKNVTHVDCRITPPDYPDAARSRGESGTTSVYFIVERSGKISHVELRKSSGFPRLDNAALTATRQGSCRPYLENGEAVRAAITESFRFGLTD